MVRQGSRTRRALAIASVAAVAAGCAASEAIAAAPSRIVFNKAYSLYTIGWDRSNLRRVNTSDDAAFDAAWSPNRKRLAFHYSNARSSAGIATARPDGSHERDVPHTRFGDQPDWAPSGKRIVFVVYRGNGHAGGALVTIRTDGKQRRRITGFSHYGQPAWSPDGKSILATRGNAIWTMRPGGGHKRQWKPNATRPSWAPNGRYVAFQRSGEVWLSWSDASHPRRVYGDGFSPVFSPNSESLAFSRKNRGIWSVSRNGGSARQVSDRGYDPDW